MSAGVLPGNPASASSSSSTSNDKTTEMHLAGPNGGSSFFDDRSKMNPPAGGPPSYPKMPDREGDTVVRAIDFYARTTCDFDDMERCSRLLTILVSLTSEQARALTFDVLLSQEYLSHGDLQCVHRALTEYVSQCDVDELDSPSQLLAWPGWVRT